MEVNNSHFYSEWTIFRAVKDLFFYFIPRFFVVDSMCAVGPKMMPKNTLYNLCDKMLYPDPTTEQKMTEKHNFSRLFNGLTGGKGLNPSNTTYSTPNNCKLPHYTFLRPKNDEFSMYDKIVKAEDVRKPEMDLDLNFLLQIRCGVKICAENATESSKNSPAENSAPNCANLSTNIELRHKDKETAEPSLEINEISKVCDKAWRRGSNRRAKSRAAILREKKRTRCNNRRSRKANRSNLIKNDVNCTLTQENRVAEEKNVQNVPELQLDVDFQWSFVSENEEEDLPFVGECSSSSVTYIIDAPESLTICLEDDWDCVDDDWDCVDDGSDNDDVWASFQQCGLQAAGLFLGNFVRQDAIDGTTMSEESEEELNCRIRIADANARWERGLNDDALMVLCSEKKKVHFAPDLVRVHSLTSEDDEDSRKGPWEEYARDRERFTKKIDHLDSIISPILLGKHRAKIYDKLYR